MTIDVIWYVYIFIIGLFLGSFYNVVGIRVPEKETLLGRSHCPKCDHQIGWIELLPVIGYIILGGKCKNCKSPISVKYPLIELLTAILFLVFYIILKENMVEYILVVVFISLMTIVTVSDLYYKVVPDIILLFFFPIILGLRLYGQEMVWFESILGGVLAFVFLYLIALYGKKRFNKDALGGGDIKLYFLIGLFLGYQTVFLSLIFAAVIGLIFGLFIKKDEQNYIAFVPFIYAGSMLAYVFGSTIIEAYETFLLGLM